MAYTFRWHDDAHTILVCDIRERWTWDEAHAMVREQLEWMGTVQHGVHTVFWLHGIPTFPTGGSALTNIRKLMSMEGTNEELSIFIGLSRFGQTMADMAGRVYGFRDLLARYRFVMSIEEALDEITRYERERA